MQRYHIGSRVETGQTDRCSLGATVLQGGRPETRAVSISRVTGPQPCPRIALESPGEYVADGLQRGVSSGSIKALSSPECRKRREEPFVQRILGNAAIPANALPPQMTLNVQRKSRGQMYCIAHVPLNAWQRSTARIESMRKKRYSIIYRVRYMR